MTVWRRQTLLKACFHLHLEQTFNVFVTTGETVNSLRLSDTYASVNQAPALVQIMSSRLFATSHYLNQWWLIVNWTLRKKDFWGKFWWKFQHFHSRKCLWKFQQFWHQWVNSCYNKVTFHTVMANVPMGCLGQNIWEKVNLVIMKLDCICHRQKTYNYLDGRVLTLQENTQ